MQDNVARMLFVIEDSVLEYVFEKLVWSRKSLRNERCSSWFTEFGKLWCFLITYLVFLCEEISLTFAFQRDSKIRQSRTTERPSPRFNEFGKLLCFPMFYLGNARPLKGFREILEQYGSLNRTLQSSI